MNYQKAKRMLWGRQMFTTTSMNLEQFAEQRASGMSRFFLYFQGKNPEFPAWHFLLVMWVMCCIHGFLLGRP